MYTQDEDEDFSRMISDLAGPQQPSSSVYTPPPAAAEPQLQERVKGRDFGVGDIAMLGGILASIFAKKPGLTGQLAAQYGGAVMQDSARRDAQNQEIDRYNNKLLNSNDPMSRWQADTNAKLAAGNLEARNAAQALQDAHESRIVQRQLDESDPNSDLNRSKMQLESERADLDRGTYRDRVKADQEAKLALLAQEYKYKQGVPRPAKAVDPIKQIQHDAVMKGLQDGSIDPVTLKPVDKPQTPAQKLATEKQDALLVPFDGYEVADENLWRGAVTNPANRAKLLENDTQIATALDALDEMAKIRAVTGGESATFGDANAVSRYNLAKAKNAAAVGQIKNTGVQSPTEAAMVAAENIPGIEPSARDLLNDTGLGDNKLAMLKGAREQLAKMRDQTAAKHGLRPKSAQTQPKFAVKNGKRFSLEGKTPAQIEALRNAEGWSFE